MQIFRPGANTIAILLLASLAVLPVLTVGLAYQIVGSPYVTEQNVTRDQPVPFSHEHHVGGLGLDGRYFTPPWRMRVSRGFRRPKPA
jgi:hypothetical protein